MGEQLAVGRLPERAQAQEADVVAELAGECGFSASAWGRRAADARHLDDPAARRGLVGAHRVGGQGEHGPQEADLADRELRGVHAHRHPPAPASQ